MQAPITILFGNKERKLRFDVEAMLDLEAALNKTTREVMSDLAMLSFNTLVVALWAGLKHEDTALNINLVRKYFRTYEKLPGADIKALFKAVLDALKQSQWYQQVTAEEGESEGKPDGAE